MGRMEKPVVHHFVEKTKNLFNASWSKLLASFHQRRTSLSSLYLRFLTLQINPFWVHLHYFLAMSAVGFSALKITKTRTNVTVRPKSLDLFFTSVSATTVSSMSTVEMEAFSNTQLAILTILMFVGGEVFTSMLGLGLQLMRSKFKLTKNNITTTTTDCESQRLENSLNQIELGMVPSLQPAAPIQSQSQLVVEGKNNNTSLLEYSERIKSLDSDSGSGQHLHYNSIKCLSRVVACYLLVVNLVGSTLIFSYMKLLVPSAGQVLKEKGLRTLTFSVFTTVSTFTNCGFVPTNENMMVFRNNSGLLLLLIPQVLLGNTLYAPSLRLLVWFLEKITKREEYGYILKNHRRRRRRQVLPLGYGHLLSRSHSVYLAATVSGLLLLHLALFCSMEWTSSSEAMGGLNSSYQKLVASLFQVVNSRHAGESVVDLSLVAPANLVLIIVMMYLPPYTRFFLADDDDDDTVKTWKKSTKKGKKFVDYILFSQLSYLVIFVALICITEREKMKDDPLNFNIINIAFEVISAYGNVGFSTGYSCQRRLKFDDDDKLCKDAWYGFVGRWSNNGKLILILVMFFGRLKSLEKGGGKAWKLN
ncbi:sodium transporter HKT1-like [Diospyros lotus]|uniref:sodium transporter HKT1-like n=1 Tax=Diospyros lotus TaxID=55363 RepID=UPI002253A35E|nr:sodium transporter HKT1-like [Diospyros lotus]